MSIPEPALFCIFGGTGDLSRRKLLPALCSLAEEGNLHPRTQVLATGRGELSDDDFRQAMRVALAGNDLSEESIVSFCDDRLQYQAMGQGGAEEFRALGECLESLERTYDLHSNRAFYMAMPPEAFIPAIEGLGGAGLNHSRGWTRLVVEKPFGRDLASAQELNRLIHRYFSEKQVYRIDHYLGKETVQNLLVFRLSNALIESAWNRDRVDSIQITVSETFGVGTRAGYYDRSGAVRDMVQNHLTQLLSLVAMEVPSSFDADAIRFEKIKVLRTLAPIQCDQVVRGQYTAGQIDGQPVAGYLDEEGVPAESQTETFVAMRMFVDSWRWQGVPFYLRSGKRMPRKMTQIAVRFREAPVSFFEKLGCSHDTADVLVITLQPDEGFTLHLDIKAPGTPFRLERIPLGFHYQDRFAPVPEAYQTLLEDVISGDQTLFVHGDEVEESWRVYTPLLEDPPGVRPYPAPGAHRRRNHWRLLKPTFGRGRNRGGDQAANPSVSRPRIAGLGLTLSIDAFNIFNEGYVLSRNTNLNSGSADVLRHRAASCPHWSKHSSAARRSLGASWRLPVPRQTRTRGFTALGFPR